jgi:hypothetical protein
MPEGFASDCRLYHRVYSLEVFAQIGADLSHIAMASCADRLAQQTGDALQLQPHDSSSLPEKPKKRRFWKVGKAVTALTHLFGEPTSDSIDNHLCFARFSRFVF